MEGLVKKEESIFTVLFTLMVEADHIAYKEEIEGDLQVSIKYKEIYRELKDRAKDLMEKVKKGEELPELVFYIETIKEEISEYAKTLN
jgi:hypothetical protein